MVERILSKLFLISNWVLLSLSIRTEISFDFLNKDLSLDFEISFFSFSKFLRERRKYVVVIIFAAAAILTPPDPITQIGLAIPLLILYELSIFSVNIIEKKIKNNA